MRRLLDELFDRLIGLGFMAWARRGMVGLCLGGTAVWALGEVAPSASPSGENESVAADSEAELAISEMFKQLEQADAAVIAAIRKVDDTVKSESAANRSEHGFTRQTPEAADVLTMENDLRQIAQLFSAETRMGIPQIFEPANTAESWAPEIKALRDRAIRSGLARQLGAVELLAAPLDALPLPQAIRQLEQNLFAQSDWTRLYRLLMGVDGFDGASGRDEEGAGVKAFVVGQNYERAEQYGDAIESYRQVLTCVGDLVPVAPAADRLKALNREHPEAFKPRAR